jgi:hypothetical protein
MASPSVDTLWGFAASALQIVTMSPWAVIVWSKLLQLQELCNAAGAH